MDTLWPWLALAGSGALHGINPASGWFFCNGPRALLPIALGHVASVVLVAAAVPVALALGLAIDAALLHGVAAGVLLAAAAHFLVSRLGQRSTAPAGRSGLALWSFGIATAQGAGLMLVPALIPLCLGETPARELTASGSMVLALCAVGLHLGAMLGATAAMACGARYGLAAWRRRSALR
jgi:hypothetical protein